MFYPLPAPGLGAAVSRAAEERLGIELTQGEFRLRLLEGLILQEGEAVARTPRRRYRWRLPEVRFEHRLGSLLSGVVSVERIAIEAPSMELTEIEPADPDRKLEEPLPADSASADGLLGLSLELREVSLSQASIELKSEEDPSNLRLEGVDLQLTEPALTTDEALAGSVLALEGSGKINIETGRLGDVSITDAGAEIYFHEGIVSLALLRFTTGWGPFVGETRIDFDYSPFYYVVSTLGEPFDAGAVVGARIGFGEASLLLEVQGAGPAPKGFTAQGSVTLPAGELPSCPLFEAVNALVGRAVFTEGEPYAETLAVIRVRDRQIAFQPFQLATDSSEAEFRGAAGLDGALDLTLSLRTRREGIQVEDMDARRLDLWTDESGWITLPLKVRGTIERPLVRVTNAPR